MNRFRDRRGFTLLELMIVVVILAVLAVVAVFSYKKYMRKARTQEAIGILGDIKIKQAQFFASYGQYISTSPSVSEWDDDAGYWPAAVTPGNSVPWQVDCQIADPNSPEGRFCQLGVRPTSEVHFQFKTVGWNPNDSNFSGTPPDGSIPNQAWQNAGSPMWWYASARTWWDPDDRRSQASVAVLTSVLLNQPLVKEAYANDFAE